MPWVEYTILFCVKTKVLTFQSKNTKKKKKKRKEKKKKEDKRKNLRSKLSFFSPP
jgi:hypothetical protein